MTNSMTRAGLAALVVGAVFTAGGASAQSRTLTPYFAGAGWQGGSPADVRAGVPLSNDRAIRAARVAELIDSGQCEAARRLSLSEGDYGMARKAQAICYLRSHPAAATPQAKRG